MGSPEVLVTTATGRDTVAQATDLSRNGAARRLDIQGLRAVAVLMVVLFHAGLPIPGGFVGVDVFFVISGYVITAMLMREWANHGRIRLGRFYVRRFKRLTPALALTVSVTMIIGFFVLSPLGTQQDASRTGIGAMLLSANFVISRLTGDYFALEAETNVLLNTWSLSVEEQFYLAFPAVLFLAWTVSRRLRSHSFIPILAVSLVGVASFGLAMAGAAGFTPPVEAWLTGFYSPLTRAWEFAGGALLALLGERVHVRSKPLASALGAFGAGLLGVSLVAISGDSPFPSVATLVPVTGTVVLLAAGNVPDGSTSRVLSSTPLVRIGDWSYSIYLWHWPLIVFATILWPHSPWAAPLAAAVSFLPAIASYYWVETPLRTRATPRVRDLLLFVLSVVAPPIVLSVTLWQASEHAFWQPDVKAFQSAVFAQPNGCSRFAPLSADNADECTWNEEGGERPVYLLGDSNAGHFVDAVTEAGRRLDRPVVVTTTNACPFLDVSLDRLDKAADWDGACRDFVQGTLKYLTSDAERGTVIVSNVDTYWDEGGYAIGATPDAISVEPANKLIALHDGLTRTVETLHHAGHEVLLVQTIPRWAGEDTWATAGCTVARIRDDGCEQFMPIERAIGRQGAVRVVVTDVAAETGTAVFDPWPVLCPTPVCSTNHPDGFPRYYRDGIHVSVLQGGAMAPRFETFMTTGSST